MRILLDGGAYASTSTAVRLERRVLRRRPVRVDERAHRVDGGLHEQPALRRDARLRRGADLLRGRGADGQAGGGARDRPGGAAAPQRAGAGRRAADGQRGQRVAAGGRGDPARRCASSAEPEELPRDPLRLPAGPGTRRAARRPPRRRLRVGFKNICYSEGFDDFCAARVVLARGRERRGALRPRPRSARAWST